MTSFVSRPSTLEAVQWDGTEEGWPAVRDFAGGGCLLDTTGERPQVRLWVKANTSWLPLEPSEWVARDDVGFYPIKDEMFQRRWKRADICGDQHPLIASAPCDQRSGHDGNHLSPDGFWWSQTQTVEETAIADAKYWESQFVHLMRALGLETDPWHSDDVIAIAKEFVKPRLLAPERRAEAAELVGKIIYEWWLKDESVSQPWDKLHPDSLARQIVLTPTLKILAVLSA